MIIIMNDIEDIVIATHSHIPLIAVIRIGIELTEDELFADVGVGGEGAQHHGGVSAGYDLVALHALFDFPSHAVCHRSRAQHDRRFLCGGVVFHAQIVRLILGRSDGVHIVANVSEDPLLRGSTVKGLLLHLDAV